MMHAPREDWALTNAIVLKGWVAPLNIGPLTSLFKQKVARAMSVKKERKETQSNASVTSIPMFSHHTDTSHHCICSKNIDPEATH